MKLIRTLVHNTSFTLISQLMVRASNTLLFVIVSRLLGARAAGIYTLALSYTMLATRLSFWGLDQILIRETAKNSSEIRKFFVNFLIIRGGIAVLAWLLLCAVVSLLLPYDAYTKSIIMIVGVIIVPENIVNLCEAVFISQGHIQLTLYGRVVSMIVRLVGGSGALFLEQRVDILAWFLVGSSFLALAVDLWLVLKKFIEKGPWMFDWHFAQFQLRAAGPLTVSGMFYVLDNRLDVLMISFFLDEAEVGIYNAAATIVSTILIIPQAYQVAVLPTMSRLYSDAGKGLKNLYVYSVKYLLVFAMPMSIIITYWGKDLVSLFGQDFLASLPVLQVLTWMLPLLFLNVPTARLLVSTRNQRIIAHSLLVRLLLSATSSVALVLLWGGRGVAIARLIASLSMVVVNIHYVHFHLFDLRELGHILRQIALASLVFAGMRFVLHALFPIDLILGSAGYLLFLWVNGFYSQRERELLGNLTRMVILD
jgi:O-antigen/teichoic acid export membrane protein